AEEGLPLYHVRSFIYVDVFELALYLGAYLDVFAAFQGRRVFVVRGGPLRLQCHYRQALQSFCMLFVSGGRAACFHKDKKGQYDEKKQEAGVDMLHGDWKDTIHVLFY